MTTRNHTPGPWHFAAQNSGINSDGPGWGLLNADVDSVDKWRRGGRSITDRQAAKIREIWEVH